MANKAIEIVAIDRRRLRNIALFCPNPVAFLPNNIYFTAKAVLEKTLFPTIAI
ncbi:MAG: hypothetical protein WBB29_21575 [Geitlerinemataceae cyanobacterium]